MWVGCLNVRRLSFDTFWVSRSTTFEREPVSEYARSALEDMLGSVAASPDLLGALQSPVVDEAVLGVMLPAVVRFLGLGIDLAVRTRTEGGVALGSVEKVLETDGREVLRLLLQGVMDLAADQEERRVGGVLGSDGVARTRVEKDHSRGVATVFGKITARRMAYRAGGAANLHPLDEVLSLPGGLYSDGLRERSCLEAARGSFTSTGHAVARSSGVRIGTRQLIGLVRNGAQDADAFYRERVAPRAPDDVLVITADGKGVVVRPEALRSATAKAARKAPAGSGGNRKRMAEVVCVHDLRPVPRTVDDIIAPTGEHGDPDGDRQVRAKAPVATGKWLSASIIEDIPAVIRSGFDEADRRDPGHERTWIALVDGNITQIEAITAQAAARQVDVTILIDFLHVSGYVWDAAKAFFYTETTAGMAAARTWVAGRNRLILQGKALEVAARITARARDSKLTTAQRKTTATAATYLINKAPYLDYPRALACGWPIATGVIEGACRHLVADRMDITGSRWGLDTAQAVLTLRAIMASDDFDAYWAYHVRQQHLRNHTSIAHHQDNHALAA